MLLLATTPASAQALVRSNTESSVATAFALGVAFLLGTLIGLERQWRQRSAGLRTTVLVAIGAAGFADLGGRLTGAAGSVSLIAYVISGIGFLGAGVILKEGANIRGLNTAATLWCSASVGAFAGAGLPVEAGIVTILVLAANTALRPLVNWVNRRPLGGPDTESQYIVHIVCALDDVTDVRDLLEAHMQAAGYPVREVETLSEGNERVELAATLIPSTAIPAELDAAVAAIERSDLVETATWTVSATS